MTRVLSTLLAVAVLAVTAASCGNGVDGKPIVAPPTVPAQPQTPRTPAPPPFPIPDGPLTWTIHTQKGRYVIQTERDYAEYQFPPNIYAGRSLISSALNITLDPKPESIEIVREHMPMGWDDECRPESDREDPSDIHVFPGGYGAFTVTARYGHVEYRLRVSIPGQNMPFRDVKYRHWWGGFIVPTDPPAIDRSAAIRNARAVALAYTGNLWADWQLPIPVDIAAADFPDPDAGRLLLAQVGWLSRHIRNEVGFPIIEPGELVDRFDDFSEPTPGRFVVTYGSCGTDNTYLACARPWQGIIVYEQEGPSSRFPLGWGESATMGHELLHLLGFSHPKPAEHGSGGVRMSGDVYGQWEQHFAQPGEKCFGGFSILARQDPSRFFNSRDLGNLAAIFRDHPAR